MTDFGEMLGRAAELFAAVRKSPLGIRPPSDPEVLEQFILYEAELASLKPEDADTPAFDDAAMKGVYDQLLYDWAHDGYGWLRTTPAFAAAMMCTDPQTILPEDLELPWSAFLIEMPSPCPLSIDGAAVTHAFVDGWKDRRTGKDIRVTAMTGPGLDGSAGEVSASWSELLTKEPKTERERVTLMCTRLGIGLLLARAQGAFVDRSVPAQRSRGPWRKGAPAHRVAVVGRPITSDFSDAVQRYIRSGGRTPASVQSVVTGHYKRQPFGPGGTSRKIIWVEPYWRGPEDAPILARPYKVGSAEKRSTDR